MALFRNRSFWERTEDLVRGGITSFTRFALLATTLVVIAWYYVTTIQIAGNAPDFAVLAQVDFRVAQGTTRVIGQRDLGQPPGMRSAETQHIAFEHRPDGQLYLRNVAEEKRLDVYFRHGGTSVYSDHFEIPEEKIGWIEIEIGSQTIHLTRDLGDQVKIEVQETTGRTVTRVTGKGGISLNGPNQPDWCSPDLGVLKRFVIWPLQFISRHMSYFMNQVNPYSNGGGRGIANIGGTNTCRLESGIVQVALPTIDPELEFGILRVSDKVGIRMYIHPVRLPSNVPIIYRRVESGKVVHQPEQFDRLRWPLTSSKSDPVVQAQLTSGFTAGFTRYDILVSAVPASQDWAVSLRPKSREAYFRRADCDILFGLWPPVTMPAWQTEHLEDCPGPSSEENADFTFLSMEVAPAFDRMMLGGRVRFLENPNLPNDFQYGRAVLSMGEEFLRALLVFVVLGLLLRVLTERTPGGRFNRSARKFVVLCTIGLLFLSSLSDYWYGASPEILFAGNVTLFVCAALATFLDNEGGLRAQAFQLVSFAMVFIGALTLFALSAEGNNADWERFFIKHRLFVLELLPAYWVALSLASVLRIRNAFGATIIGRDRWYSIFRLVPLGMLSIFLVWWAFGTQQGLLGLQPVELGKIIVIIGLAGVLARWALKVRMLGWVSVKGAVVGAAITFFVVVVLAVPVLKGDYSPVIIICGALFGTLALAMTWTVWEIFDERRSSLKQLKNLPARYLPHRAKMLNGLEYWYPVAAATGLVLLIFGALVAHAYVVPDGWKYRIPPNDQIAIARTALGEGRRTVHERLLNWADMRYDARYTNAIPAGEIEAPLILNDRGLAYQGMRSRTAIANAKCGVSDEFGALAQMLNLVNLPGLANIEAVLCMPLAADEMRTPTTNCTTQDLKQPVEPHCIPVIQSDFIATYLIARHGFGAGIVLLALQFMFVWIGLTTFVALKRKATREPVVSGARDAFSTMILGATLLFGLQWVLSWGNAFVLLPIMGQPMTWVSAAISHHVFMAMPGLFILLIGLRIAGAKQHTIPFGQFPNQRLS